ncbi:Trypanosomal VSG domain/Trypanosome variant surface glycoprotein C-terminal domain containing protein, putative [Trypanosoma equiperdum]|uniref:Trypanosomal VSG domain/Trypanosome variant surface glycoprotein C-terminal domain containing protein, putative n=1 Tax=Trypanosoma equiperdum TaxID=5694 RepID=A0A1G4I6C3_TRYEQ|nr:Trypanosomal VSG domain/Trypanosome variant surface glycoprotein C-terminal domain containing protein, putative [Trypanosoma equiperdum]
MGTSADAKGDDCDGSGTKTCVSYTKYFVKNNGVDITEIPWYEALTTAATAIDSAKHNTHELRATLAQLAAVEAAVRITYNAAAAGRLAITAPQQTVHQHQAKQQATEIVEECHKHHGNNTICPKDKCTYGEKEKKCNPKVLEEATTGTGEGAAGTAAATGCAKHGTKAECDADKKDDKQNCAWRKGKEGETDEPEKEKCRSSSFLLNKQLALSMVAEFVFFL